MYFSSVHTCGMHADLFLFDLTYRPEALAKLGCTCNFFALVLLKSYIVYMGISTCLSSFI